MTAHGPVGVRDKMQQLEIWRHALSPASGREQVVRKVIFVVFPAIVLSEEHFDGMPRAFDGVCVGPSVGVDEVDAVVDSPMSVTLLVEIAASSPRIADDRSAGFNPVTYYGHQCIGGSVRYRNEECVTGFTLNTTEHPLTLDRVSSMIFTPTEFALINFDGLVRTTYLDGAPLQRNLHGFPTEHPPV